MKAVIAIDSFKGSMDSIEAAARFGLHSQTTRLVDGASWGDRVRAGRGSHPPRRPFPGDLGPVRR